MTGTGKESGRDKGQALTHIIMRTLTCFKHVLLANIKIIYLQTLIFDILVNLCFSLNKLAKKHGYVSGLLALDSLMTSLWCKKDQRSAIYPSSFFVFMR